MSYIDELMKRPQDRRAELTVACAEVDRLRLALAASRDEAEKAKARAALIDDVNYNLTVLIGRLCHSYRKVDPDNKIVASATDYLRRINKMGSPLRADAARTHAQEPKP